MRRLASAVPGARAASTVVRRLRSRPSALRAAARLEAAGHPTARAYAAALRDLHRGPEPSERAAFEAVEALRARLARSTTPVEMEDFGAGTRQGAAETAFAKRVKATTVGELTRSTSKPPRWARFLFHVVRRTGATAAVELGTSMGVSAAYQGARCAWARTAGW